MERLSERLNDVRVDVVQRPSTFYFAAPDRTMSLSDSLPGVLRLARGRHEGEDERRSAEELSCSLEYFARTVGSRRPGMPDATVDRVVEAYRWHHHAGR